MYLFNVNHNFQIDSQAIYVPLHDTKLESHQCSGMTHDNYTKYWVSLTIWIYTMVYLFTIDVIFLPSKVVNIHNFLTTNLTFFG